MVVGPLWLHAHSTCSRFLAVWFPTSGILFSTYSPFWYYCPPLLVTLFVHHTTPHFGICAHWPQICHAPRWPIPQFCNTLVKLRPFPRPRLTSWLCHRHPILCLGFTDGRSRWSLFPTSFNSSIVPALPFSHSSCLNRCVDRYHQFLWGRFYVFVSALMSSTR